MTGPVPIVLAEDAGELLWFTTTCSFKATSDQTGGAFILFEEWAPRGKVTPLHGHPNEDESFYVLDGEGARPDRRHRASRFAGELQLGAPGSTARDDGRLRDRAR